MANIKISQLPAASVVTANNDVLPIVHSGVTQKVTPDLLVQTVLSAPGPIGGGTAGSGAFTSLTATGAVTLSPNNANVAISPSGAGIVNIQPDGGLLVNPALMGSVDNVTIGASTPRDGNFIGLTSAGITTLNGTTIPPGKILVSTDSVQLLTNKTISGSSNNLSNIGNAALTNSSITINGSSVSLGGSVTVTAAVTNALTIGTGLSGGSYNGSSPVTIAIDSTVATLSGAQALTNKTISGSSNTLSNIANASLTNSSVTINGTPVSLGGSISIPGMTYPGAGIPVSTGSAWSTSLTAPSGALVGTTDAQGLSNKTITASTLNSTAIGASSASTGAFTTLTATLDSSFTSTGALLVSKGTTGEQPGSPVTGMIRYNTSTNQFEGYSGSSPAWSSLGGGGGGSGTVTSVSVVTANGLAGTVANASTTPAITLSTSVTGLLKGNGTAISAAVSGTDYAPATSGTSILYGNGSGGFSNVTVGSGLSFTAGTLASTSSGGTVTSVSGAGTVSGLTLTGTVTTSGSLTLGGTLDLSAYNAAGAFTNLSYSGTLTGGTGVIAIGTNQIYKDASGNVGIGTSSPPTKLGVTKSTTDALAITNSTVALLSTSLSNDVGASIGFAYGSWQFSAIKGFSEGGGTYGGGLGFWTAETNSSWAERMRIDSSGQCIWKPNGTTSAMTLDSSGNLLVGTTSVLGSSKATLFGVNVPLLGLQRGGTVGNVVMFYAAGGANVGQIYLSGTDTLYQTNSDYRLKENVQPLQNAVSRVALLKPSKYVWKADQSEGEGFIAHELQEVVPQAVSGEKDGEQMQGVDYGKLTPLLVAAIQELHAEIELIKAKVN